MISPAEKQRLRLVILLIEDNPDDAELIRHSFGCVRPNVPIKVVPTGESAVAYLSGEPPYDDRLDFPMPSLILVDLGLPGISGLQVLKWIRSRPEFRDTPVVVLTSSNVPRDIQSAYEEGSNSFLVKPTLAQDFEGMMESLCTFWELNIR